MAEAIEHDVLYLHLQFRSGSEPTAPYSTRYYCMPGRLPGVPELCRTVRTRSILLVLLSPMKQETDPTSYFSTDHTEP